MSSTRSNVTSSDEDTENPGTSREQVAGGSGLPRRSARIRTLRVDSLLANAWSRPADIVFAKHTLRIRRFFSYGYAITDLAALGTMGFVLYQIERFVSRMDNGTLLISVALVLEGVKYSNETLAAWEPLVKEVTMKHLKECRRLNFPRCFKKLLAYITTISKILGILIRNCTVGDKLKEFDTLLHCIRIHVGHKDQLVKNKFRALSGIPPKRLILHWAPVQNYSHFGYVPSNCPALLTFIDDPSASLPPWIMPRNSKIMLKMCLGLQQFLFFAELDYCTICLEPIAGGQSLCILPFCDHIFCYGCITARFQPMKVFERFCPSCPPKVLRAISEYGVLPGNPQRNRFICYSLPFHNITLKLFLVRKLYGLW